MGFAPNEWDALLKYLKSKGISEELMLKAGLIIAREGKSGYYDRFRNRIVFPILDIQNRFVAFGARAMAGFRRCQVYQLSGDRRLHQRPAYVWPAVDQGSGWEIGSDHRGGRLHGYDHALRPRGGKYSGIFRYGINDRQIRLIRRYTHNVVMLFDTDAAGQSAIVRSLDLLD